MDAGGLAVLTSRVDSAENGAMLRKANPIPLAMNPGLRAECAVNAVRLRFAGDMIRPQPPLTIWLSKAWASWRRRVKLKVRASWHSSSVAR
jgi:hypothetical protein